MVLFDARAMTGLVCRCPVLLVVRGCALTAQVQHSLETNQKEIALSHLCHHTFPRLRLSCVVATPSTMATILPLIQIPPILQTLASFLSTLDLFYLALTCKSNYYSIVAWPVTFRSLQRNCLCDGKGLAERQTFTGLYRPPQHAWGKQRPMRPDVDELPEVRLFNLKCDEAGTLPCCKCGINVCEECRYYPRELAQSQPAQRRPHLNAAWESTNVMCLCTKCDAQVEKELHGKYLNEQCECDIYKRWVCCKCVREERAFTQDYYENHTEMDGDGLETKCLIDHQFYLDVSETFIFGSGVCIAYAL